MENTDKLLNNIIANAEAENIAVSVGVFDKTIFDIYKSKNGSINKFTKFDMASVTKIIATTSLALIALDRGLISLENSVADFLPCPQHRKDLTIKHLLTHTIGIGHKNMCADGYTYENIYDYIFKIPIDIPIGTDVLYSCPGFVLLGKVLEKVFGKRQDILFNELIAVPLNLKYTGYLPKEGPFVNSGLNTEDIGKVNDYNCRYLGGVAGNAGIFSNMVDMKKYVSFLLDCGAPIISEQTFRLATKNYTDGMSESRGLGFMIVDDRYKQTGNLFKNGAIGHCGHTGQSVFVDLQSGLWAIILSDMTISTTRKFGNENYNIVIKNREQIHNAILEDFCHL